MRATFAIVTLALALLGCSEDPGNAIILATTTSAQDSGLLDVLVPAFESGSGYEVRTVAVGTGQALATAARGEADVAFVHAPELELRYVSQGDLVNRRPVMHNDFVILGPGADPAGVAGAKDLAGALSRIASTGATFVSRGDSSGTNMLEGRLWRQAGVSTDAPWYTEAGQGMGATLVIASERQAYTLSDRGTFLAFAGRLGIGIRHEGSPELINPYHVLEANADRHPRVNREGARALSDFFVSREAQKTIQAFGRDRYGQPLFFPDADR